METEEGHGITKGPVVILLTQGEKYHIIFHIGEVAERLKALVLKTSEVKASVGSNPTLSATSRGDYFLDLRTVTTF